MELEINSLGTPDDRQRYRAQLVAWLQEQADQLDPDSQERLKTNPLRILDGKNKTTRLCWSMLPPCWKLCRMRVPLASLVQIFLRQLVIPFRVNTRLVRSLDYYGHTAFEIRRASRCPGHSLRRWSL